MYIQEYCRHIINNIVDNYNTCGHGCTEKTANNCQSSTFIVKVFYTEDLIFGFLTNGVTSDEITSHDVYCHLILCLNYIDKYIVWLLFNNELQPFQLFQHLYMLRIAVFNFEKPVSIIKNKKIYIYISLLTPIYIHIYMYIY